MPVSDEVVEAVRAQVAGTSDEYRRSLRSLDRETASVDYPMLVAAAFFKATFRRFAREGTMADVVDFVAHTRARSEEASDMLDPTLAERMILAALGKGSLKDLDGNTRVRIQGALLIVLVQEADFDEAGLEAFLADARKLADEWMASGDE